MALSYPLFVLGSLCMLVLVPVSMVICRDRKHQTRWLRRALHLGARLWVNLSQWLQLIRVEIDDRRTATGSDAKPAKAAIPDDSPPTLIIANHPSLIDVLLVSAALPNLCCVLKGNLHYNPLFTLLIRYLDYLPNSDPELMLKEGSRRLQAGEQLLIFPEGTRTTPLPLSGSAQRQQATDLHFRFGAAELAQRSGAAALPVVIHYKDHYLSKGYPWYRMPANVMHYRLEIGPAIPGPNPQSALPGCPHNSSALRSERKKLRRRINERWINHFVERLTGPGVGN